MSRRLFTVGPVEVRDEVLEAMAKPMIVHRGEDYVRLQKGIVEKLHKILDTDMCILMAPASASGLLESCVRCGVSRKMLGISNGSFGERWQMIGSANGKVVQKIEVPWGLAVKAKDVESKVDEDVEAVAIVSNESSTGVLNPLGDVIEAVRARSDPLIFVDGVTAVGGIDLGLRRLDIDALVFGTQKALALPPGLALICASDRLLEKARKVESRGYYFDLLEIKKYADKDLPLTTPPVSLLYGLDFQLDRMIKEGMANRYRRHAEMAGVVRSWAEKRFALFAEKGHRSNTITVIEKGKMDFGTMHTLLKQKGLEISAGYGKIKERTFRVGHMGDLTVDDIKLLTRTIDEVLEGMK
ncbi:MAG: alanine--glyoxylate aminotransferase family protein [Methanomassiliicoccales archaeon]|nr:alanine--glyoxylate aminotransferase family protein [Methanomassiliicoccales archaeon]